MKLLIRMLSTIVLAVGFLLGASPATGQVQLPWISINSGGVCWQSSTSYVACLTIGQTVSGPSQSTNYKVNFGFCQVGIKVGTDVQEIPTSELPSTYSLAQNYPNPFNPSTAIEFTVPVRGDVRVSVYNLLGQRVATLVDQPMSPGTYRTDWNGRDEAGNPVASGIYFYRLEAEQFLETRKMMLLK